ncbi:MAG: hypothetical protein WCS99_12225 [Limisphaerales bacterium]
MKKLTGLFGVVLCATVVAAADKPAAQPRLGMNLAGPADWSTELAFVDVFHQSRVWISQKTGAGWGRGPELALDEFGWVTKLEPGCFAESMLCTISGGHYPSGIYTVFYDGEGRLDFPRNARVKEAGPGRILIDVDSSKSGFSVQLKETNPQNHVRNIRVIMPGGEATCAKDPFQAEFLKRWRGFACYRFMDWMHINGSQIKTWADRPTLRHATFSKRGVALELMIELCNRQRVAPWFCMPHLADDDFVRRFAEMVRERLDPSLKIYIEYSNEVWNGQFVQNRYACEQGVKLGLGPKEKPWEAGWRFTAVRSMEIFKIWEDVFGGHDRFVRVLPTQAGVGSVSEGILGYRDAARHADALAGAPYMGYSIGRGKTADLVAQMQNWSVAQMLDHFEQTAFTDSLTRMAKDKAIADKYGLKLIAYEGGQHMVAFLQDQQMERTISATMHACNRHPRMGEIYRRYYDEWARLGGDTFAVFSSTGEYGKHGAWGLAEFSDSKPADYPKLAATLEWAKNHGQPVELWK